MKAKLFFLSIITTILFAGCSGHKNELVGEWKVSDVKTDFDETRTTPQMLQQVVEIEKQNRLKFLDDSSLLIIIKGNTYEALWKMGNDHVIHYHFKNDSTTHKLGVYSKPYIIAKSNTKIGAMTTTYEKE